MSNQSYQNPHALHERELADTVASEAVEIIYGPKQQPNRRGGCLILLATAALVAGVIVVGWLL